MASYTLSQPLPSAYTPPPRKSSLKKPQQACLQPHQGQLKGLALQITAGPASPPVVHPATEQFKHSLFYEPPSSPPTAHFGKSSPGLPRCQHARRRFSRPESLITRSQSQYSDVVAEEDELSPLPTNTSFGSSSPSKRHPSKRLKRAAAPDALPTGLPPPLDQPTSPTVDNDKLSPLPEKTRFNIPTPRSPEYPISIERRPSSSIARSKSTSTSRTVPHAAPSSAMRSIFPQYDHGKTLEQQEYYPAPQAYTPSLPSEKVSKLSSPTEKPTLERFDSAVALVDGYEHIPTADDGDMLAIWNASSGHFPVAGRKVRLGLHQPSSHGTSLAIGSSGETFLYSMEKAVPHSPSQKEKKVKPLGIMKHDHSQVGTAVAVAQLSIPEPPASDSKQEPEATVIFPQAAAIHALELAANSPLAAEIATFDPTAASPEAARLAKDAVAEAHKRYACDLSRTTRKRDSLGAVTATYSLEHPLLGTLPITVTKSLKSPATREPRAKISIHHPSATSAAVAAETLVLAFIDFARDAAVLDLPGLLALDSSYIVDTAISALFAVAAIENHALKSEAITFAPPPKAAIGEHSKGKTPRAKKSMRWSKRSSAAITKVQKELVGQPVDVAPPVEGAIAILGLTLKTAVFVLEAGLKVTTKVVGGVVHWASKP